MEVTVISFCVSVPVLSLQMLLAPPIVSQLARFLTRFYWSFILLTENARAIVTANGRPSGTATTIIVIAIMNALITIYNVLILRNSQSPLIHDIMIWIIRAKNTRVATAVPIIPISSATASNFYYSGVGGFSISRSLPI